MIERPRVYLAGPDVFLPEPRRFAKVKQELCETYGFTGVSPLDNDFDVSNLSKRAAGLAISAANEHLIRNCHLLIANLTPFRGPSADVGTAYELGFGRALGLPVFGYTNVDGYFLERTKEHLKQRVQERSSGETEDMFHMAIEDFDLVDNLMLDGAVHASGTQIVVQKTPLDKRFTDLTGFEECLRLAAVKLRVQRP